MAYGMQIRTQSGMANLQDLYSLRLVDTLTRIGSGQVSFSLAGCTDLNNTSYLLLPSVAFTNTSLSTNDDYYVTVTGMVWGYGTIGSSSTVPVTVLTNHTSASLTVSLFAVEA